MNRSRAEPDFSDPIERRYLLLAENATVIFRLARRRGEPAAVTWNRITAELKTALADAHSEWARLLDGDGPKP